MPHVAGHGRSRGPSRSQQRISKPKPLVSKPSNRQPNINQSNTPKPLVPKLKPSAPPGEKGGGGTNSGNKTLTTVSLPKKNLNKLKPKPKPKPINTASLMEDNNKTLRNTIKKKRMNISPYLNELDPKRHFAFNQEMSNAIREYATTKGVTNAWSDNKFIDELYNFTGAAQSSSMYPMTQVPQTIYSAAYQGLDAVIETYQGKSKPMKALSDGVSDFFQNVKGIFSESKSDDELLEDAFNKIDKYVAGEN